MLVDKCAVYNNLSIFECLLYLAQFTVSMSRGYKHIIEML